MVSRRELRIAVCTIDVRQQPEPDEHARRRGNDFCAAQRGNFGLLFWRWIFRRGIWRWWWQRVLRVSRPPRAEARNYCRNEAAVGFKILSEAFEQKPFLGLDADDGAQRK